jgi:hypothetical protein
VFLLARRSGVHEPVQNGGFSHEPQIVGLVVSVEGYRGLYPVQSGGGTQSQHAAELPARSEAIVCWSSPTPPKRKRYDVLTMRWAIAPEPKNM